MTLKTSEIRASARRMLQIALDGGLDDWRVDLDRLPATADFVARVTRENYPSLDVPMHSRWRHFPVEVEDKKPSNAGRLRSLSLDAAVRGRAAFDIAIASVLLDAGAGGAWRYHDEASGIVATRSEGLALASLRWFERGGLSADAADPLRVDASVLQRVDANTLAHAFQVSASNPLVGLESRASLLNRLGAAVEARPELFAVGDSPRPGGLFEFLAPQGSVSAAMILETLLDAFGGIWPDRPRGDCWWHPALGANVPFHKLSQWLTYSLVEPLQAAGVNVTEVDQLTGLPEYRNGGLLIDMEVLIPRHSESLQRLHEIGSPIVVGMRALTIALLDELAPPVVERLGLVKDQYALARVLEGGTWSAGRRIASEKRKGGAPPIQIISDGTVL